MENIKLATVTQEAESLFCDVRNTLANSTKPELKAMASRVPLSFTDPNDKINIVFAGEYSAGKSSIISHLTGKHLEVGGGVTTQTCTSFEWNGVNIIDTPGILNQGRSDHDQITFDAIANADLIIFVTTVKGFSDRVGRHFHELIINRHKGREMMLILNKMDSVNTGNTPELRQEVRDKNVAPVIAPEYTPEEFYTSYVDAECYKDSLLESDTEAKMELRRLSGWDDLINNINRFVDDKKVLGKRTTNLYRVEQILVEANEQFESGDICIDGTVSVLNTQRRMLSETADNIVRQSKSIVQEPCQKIINWGNEVADQLVSSADQKKFEANLRQKYEDTNKVPDMILEQLSKMIEGEVMSLQTQVKDYSSSEFVNNVRKAIEEKYPNISSERKSNLGKYASSAQKFGDFLLKNSLNSNAGTGLSALLKASSFSGSTSHKVIYEVGKFFGHKFKPWEAVKLAGKVGKAGKFIGAAGAFVGVGVEIWNLIQEEKAIKENNENRSGIRNQFREAAHATEMEFDELTQTWVEKNLRSRVREIDSQVNELNNMKNVKEAEGQKLNTLLCKTRKLIEKVQNV